MAVTISISPEIKFENADFIGLDLGDGEVIPLEQELKEQWVIHPEESKSGTCEECAQYEGEIFNLDEGEIPPIHANCACERVPLFETFNKEEETWNKPEVPVSLTMAELQNMEDKALETLLENDNIENRIKAKVKVVLKRRK